MAAASVSSSCLVAQALHARKNNGSTKMGAGHFALRGSRSVGPDHLAGSRQDGLCSLDGFDHLPAPTGIFLIERLAVSQFAERRYVHRLEELMIVLPHVALAAGKTSSSMPSRANAIFTGSSDFALSAAAASIRI